MFTVAEAMRALTDHSGLDELWVAGEHSLAFGPSVRVLSSASATTEHTARAYHILL